MDAVQIYVTLRDRGYSHEAAFNVVLAYLT